MPPPGCTMVLGDSQQDTRVLLSLEEVPEVTGPGGDRAEGSNPTNYVGCGGTALAAALMANLGALFISSKINPTNAVEDSLNTYFPPVRGNSCLAAGAGQDLTPVVWRTLKRPGFCNKWTTQTLPQDSLLKSGDGEGSCCRWPSPLWLPLNHSCQKELNHRAHKKYFWNTFFPLQSALDLTKYQVASINVPRLKYTWSHL